MKDGDRVNVCMSRNDCFSQDIQKHVCIIRGCILKYAPCATGDMYHFISADGIEFVVNPESRDFIGIEKDWITNGA